MGLGRCEGGSSPRCRGQRPSKAPNPVSASWSPLTPSPNSFKTPSWWGGDAAPWAWNCAWWCWCVGLGPPSSLPLVGAPCFAHCWFLMVTWGLSWWRGAFLKSSQALRVGVRGCQELPQVPAGLVGAGWGGSEALVGSVAAGSGVPPHEQLLLCPQPWSGSRCWECSWCVPVVQVNSCWGGAGDRGAPDVLSLPSCCCHLSPTSPGDT